MELTKNDLKSKVKKKSTSKSVIIDGKLHADMKDHCNKNKRKLGGVIENLIKLYLSDPKGTDNLIDNLKEA